MQSYSRILGLAAALAVVLGCGGTTGGKTNPSAAQAAPEFTIEEIVIPVEVDSPARGDISAYFETTTRIEAENRVIKAVARVESK